ncbi:MAG TPA: hypothetical protein VFO66_14555 [Gemmatimonadaceae bacterium]|nr:hypothetical protein [Gemmatimonadaceae bacterium]
MLPEQLSAGASAAAPRPQTTRLSRHVRWAFVVAPIVALLVLTAALSVSLALESGASAIVVRDLPMSTLYVLIVGLPVAYALELAVGVPLYRRRDRAGRMRRWHVVAIATLLGAVVMPIAWALLVPGQFVWLMAAYGALTGLVGGATFVAIAAPDWRQWDAEGTAATRR